MKIGWYVGKHINDITLNGLEYLLDKNNEIKIFDKKDEVISYLLENGFTEEDIYYFTFFVQTKCLNCGKELYIKEDNLSKDKLGYCYICPDCNSSFDVLISE